MADAQDEKLPVEEDAATPVDGVAVPDEETAASESEVEHDLDELLEKARERDEYLTLAQRAQADFENFRKRAQRETELAQSRGVAKLATELLPAIDNLERALSAAEDSPGETGLIEGVRLVHAELAAALKRVGVESYSPQGDQFDPELHEAMAQQPVPEADSGTVVEVYQRGYRVGDTVIRPARVVVAQ